VTSLLVTTAFVISKGTLGTRWERSFMRIGFVGAGQVNFGGGEGPWDHASRLEKLFPRYPLEIVGIADPDLERCKRVSQ